MIRVVAILLVMIGHFTGVASDIPGIEPYPLRIDLRFGTITLLVLSGYFIGPTLRRGAPGRWFRARLARLLPAYLAAVLLVYAVSRYAVVRFNGGAHQDGLSGLLFLDPVMPLEPAPDALPTWHVPDLNDLLLHVFLLHEWNPDGWHRIDGSYWTMPVQVAAFAVAALLWRGGVHRRVGMPAVLWSAMAVSAVARVVRDFAGVLPAATGMLHAYLFAAGVAIWLWQQRRLSSAQLGALLATALVIQCFHGPWPAVLGFALVLGAMCAAARGPDWDVRGTRLLRRPVSWLAGISYCLYLVHQQLGYVIARGLSEAGVSPWWLRLAMVAGAALVLGWLLTVGVERPAYGRLVQRDAPVVACSTRPVGSRDARGTFVGGPP
ncbi:acyltransferase family protein [Saccharomonospora cyanea]|uniref:Putative acyltransferase n=1 Tax=Saccharomonospora cyanea NA-134 TaxID=882082 RepID=H5XR20_9PSEU|nr:putative acyltransferase [Saccharomonospora cyanea NA-134]